MSDPIAFLMADGSRLFRRLFNMRARALGLTGQQWRVLVLIFRNPGMTQSMAAELMETEPITLSRMVDRLEDAGLVERRPAAKDRRVRCLHLTDGAIPVVEKMRDIAGDLMDQALTGFSEADQAAFRDYVERFRANLFAAQDDDERAA